MREIFEKMTEQNMKKKLHIILKEAENGNPKAIEVLKEITGIISKAE